MTTTVFLSHHFLRIDEHQDTIFTVHVPIKLQLYQFLHAVSEGETVMVYCLIYLAECKMCFCSYRSEEQREETSQEAAESPQS